ncbi:MAG: outer membrane beta-barrel protein [Flavobacterium sp.]
MKKILLFFCLFIIHFNVLSQTEKGKTMIAASSNLNFLFLSGDAYSNGEFQINLKPEISWFLAKNIALGFQLDYQYKNSKTFGTSTGLSLVQVKNTQSTITIGPQAIYFLDINDKFKAFGKGRLGLAYVGISQDNISTNEYGRFYGVTAGLSYFIVPKISTDFGIGYDSLNFNKNKTTVNGLSINLGFSLFL